MSRLRSLARFVDAYTCRTVFAIGQFAAAICLYIVEQTTPLDYLRAIYSEWVFSGIFLLCWVYIPESPSESGVPSHSTITDRATTGWLIRKGNDEKAKRMLKRINGGVPGYDLDYEFKVYRADVHAGLEEASKQGKVDWRSIYRRPVNLRRTWVSFFPLALQQRESLFVVAKSRCADSRNCLVAQSSVRSSSSESCKGHIPLTHNHRYPCVLWLHFCVLPTGRVGQPVPWRGHRPVRPPSCGGRRAHPLTLFFSDSSCSYLSPSHFPLSIAWDVARSTWSTARS